MSKTDKFKTLSKNTILFTISSFGSKIITFLMVPLYTWVLSTEDYGTVDLLTTTATLLIPVLTLNVQDAVLRFALDRNYKIKEVLNVGIKLNVFGAILLAVVLLVLAVTKILPLTPDYIMFLFLSYALGALNNSLTNYLKAKDKVKVIVVAGIANTLVACVLNLLLLLVFDMGVQGYLIANVAGIGIAVLYLFFVGGVYKDLNRKKNNALIKEMVVYSAPLIINSIAWWLNTAASRYILTFICGISISGIFAVAYKIPTILSTVQSVFYNAWSISAITEFDKEDKDGFIGNTYTAYSALWVVVCSLIMIFNILLAQILYAKDFFVAWQYVPFLLVGTTFNGIALFEGCIFAAAKKTKEVSQTTIYGAVTCTISNIVLVYFIGPMGAAFANMLGYFVTWFVRTLQMRKFICIQANWRNIIISYILIIIQAFVALKDNTQLTQVIIFILIIITQRKFINIAVKKGFNIIRALKNR